MFSSSSENCNPSSHPAVRGLQSKDTDFAGGCPPILVPILGETSTWQMKVHANEFRRADGRRTRRQALNVGPWVVTRNEIAICSLGGLVDKVEVAPNYLDNVKGCYKRWVPTKHIHFLVHVMSTQDPVYFTLHLQIFQRATFSSFWNDSAQFPVVYNILCSIEISQ